MTESYWTVFEPGEDEIIEKKSRFIAHIGLAESEEEAMEFVEKIKKQYWDARHNCFAFRVGTERVLERFSDDGEPSGTAGKPMLEVLAGRGLCNIVAVVTRYFGGTLLGTGGLVRAYTRSTQAGLDSSVLIEKKLANKMSMTCDYSFLGKVQYLAATEQTQIIDTKYEDDVTMELLVPIQKMNEWKKKITESSSGSVELEEGEDVYYTMLDGEVLIF